MTSTRVRTAMAIFGVGTLNETPPDMRDAARELDRALAPGGIALVTGPSGSGKTTILRTLERTLRRAGRSVVRTRPPGCATALDAVRAPSLDAALALLARAGLADATLLGRRGDRLSEGQRARLALATAMGEASEGCTLIADEFASSLDRTTAICLARTLRRWSRTTAVRVVVATAHDDILGTLAPDVLVHMPLDGPPTIHTRAGTNT